jgi:hypothetical protein
MKLFIIAAFASMAVSAPLGCGGKPWCITKRVPEPVPEPLGCGGKPWCITKREPEAKPEPVPEALGCKGKPWCITKRPALAHALENSVF